MTGMVVRIIESVSIRISQIAVADADQPRVPGSVLGTRLPYILSLSHEATPQAEHVGGEVNWGPGSGEETLPREPSAGGHSAHPVSPPCWLPTTVGGDMTPEAQPPEVSPRRAEARTRVSGGC